MTLNSAVSGTRTREAYERLRAAILRGELRPNEPLIEADLADLLEVSRTPIREGLQRLAADGLIVSRRRGWAVREHTREEIQDIYHVRAALEGYAARLTALQASDEKLVEIQAISRGGGQRLDERRTHLVEANDRFHEAIVGASGNHLLSDLVRRSCQYHFNYRIAAVYSDAEVAAAVAGHRQLARALRARDADSAESIARQHVLEALDNVLQKLR